jgi:predicted secreted hydrolase
VARRSLWAAAFAALAALMACAPAPPEPAVETLSVTDMLGSGDAGSFARAVAPRQFDFPADHGPHPAFRTEWWYFTGNLSGTGPAAERDFGYQLTFFRSALDGDPEPRESAWATSQAYMAHFALTAPGGPDGGFYSFERFARGAGGLAGAELGPFRVWLEGWSAEGADGMPPVRLRAATERAGIDLELSPGKPRVLQGDRGLSRKGREPGNASYYYSLTRLPTRGRISLAGETFEVSGSSWIDREWSTSVLDEGVVGWDWFSLQLEDGRDLMVYQLRREDGTADPLSAGSLVAADGEATTLTASDYRIEPRGTWRSPRTGRTYPSSWQLSLPAEELELEIEPLLAGQELSHSFVYWEGAVRFAGSNAGRPVAGRGYVELTGY